MMLSVQQVDVFYGDAQALADVSLEVPDGELVALIGANGAGKSSLIRAIAGMERPRAGKIMFRGQDITGKDSHVTANLGVGQVAEGRQVFPSLTVQENLEVGACCRARAAARSSRCRRCSRCFRVSPRGAARPPARCPAASSRCSPSAAA